MARFRMHGCGPRGGFPEGLFAMGIGRGWGRGGFGGGWGQWGGDEWGGGGGAASGCSIPASCGSSS